MKPKYFFLLIALISTVLYAQVPMEPGFAMLEAGEVAKAEAFFSKVLDKEPGNLTASICYGRAVGLNGRPEVAINLFTELGRKHPDNLEINLNLKYTSCVVRLRWISSATGTRDTSLVLNISVNLN